MFAGDCAVKVNCAASRAMRGPVGIASRAGRADTPAVIGKLLCVLGRHRWRRQFNDSGQPYMECERCGKYHEVRWMGGPGGGAGTN